MCEGRSTIAQQAYLYLREITVSVRFSLNNGATGLCVLYEFKRTKSSQQSCLKPFVRLLKAFRTLELITCKNQKLKRIFEFLVKYSRALACVKRNSLNRSNHPKKEKRLMLGKIEANKRNWSAFFLV